MCLLIRLSGEIREFESAAARSDSFMAVISKGFLVSFGMFAFFRTTLKNFRDSGGIVAVYA